MMEYPEFRVSKTTNVNKLAQAIFSNIKNVEKIQLKCIGVPSVNQAIKSIVIARGLATPSGFDIIAKPFFDMVSIEGEEYTAINIILEKQ